MRGLGEGVAFAGLCVALAWVTVSSDEAPVLAWVVTVVWGLCSDWGQKDAKKGD